MKTNEVIEAAQRFSKPYRVTNGKKFRLKDVDPGDTGDLKAEDKPRAKEALQTGVQALAELQDVLYAQDRWALLLIFQAMDAAGKDGAIKHVMSGVNPQGCQVYSFKAPTSRRSRSRLSVALHEGAAGARPHRHLQSQLLRGDAGRARASRVSGEAETAARTASPRTSGRSASRTSAASSVTCTRNGIVIRKFFLHVSKKEQKKRFLERLENPDKNWKFSAADAKERGFWDEYMEAYEETIRHTADGGCAVVRGAGGQQMVHARGRRGGRHRRPGLAGPGLPEGRRREAGGVGDGEEDAARRRVNFALTLSASGKR